MVFAEKIYNNINFVIGITMVCITTDTMNWTPITGTFVANGTEKFMVLANFKSDASTNIGTSNSGVTGTFSEYFVDAISCIPLDLPAYAGPDVWAIPGNTIYIGRPKDVGIDEACTWYNLTNTATPVANAAGFSLTVSAITATYMVKQDICGIIKYDTVVVHASALGNVEWQMLNDKLKIYPNPANDILNVEMQELNPSTTLRVTDYKLKIYDAIGQLIREEELTFKENKATISTNNLANGVYLITLRQAQGTYLQTVSRRFVVAR